MNTGEREEALTLELLQAIEQRSDVTQRRLADRLGVALGLANSYLKRCVRKGWVKVSQAPANRYLYYLTPKGFAEKSRLTGEYLRQSFQFYRAAGSSLRDVLDTCSRAGSRRLVLFGVSELAEIAMLRVREYPLQVIGIFDPDCTQGRFLSLVVWRNAEEIGAADGAIITSLSASRSMCDLATKRFGAARVWVPAILGLGRTGK
ncbi:MAG: winged helix-turn-helix transcriptional regulator [Gammaproteobacteria bacterium]|nr:winged helix-turn-helix transcriptional regulator [Gammaproteobacteria bacterium]